MLPSSQIKQLTELVNEADIDVKNTDTVNEFIGLLLEDIAGGNTNTNFNSKENTANFPELVITYQP